MKERLRDLEYRCSIIFFEVLFLVCAELDFELYQLAWGDISHLIQEWIHGGGFFEHWASRDKHSSEGFGISRALKSGQEGNNGSFGWILQISNTNQMLRSISWQLAIANIL